MTDCKTCVHEQACAAWINHGTILYGDDFVYSVEECPYYMGRDSVRPVFHAKWELFDECSNEGVYCSRCHKKVYRISYANQKIKSRWCPNCGAKMDLEVNRTTNHNEVEPVINAEWIDEWKGKYANPKYICSSCKITALSDDKIYFLTARCPHCGAHMKNGV